jgi:ferredoxin-thioredoxin reductase catalytic subunit
MPNVTREEGLTWARRMVSRYAENGPFLLHPDAVLVRNVIEGLARNKSVYGRGYCPCRPVSGDARADRANICPCRSHRRDIERDGTCECGIFVSEEYVRRRSR